ncbi:MULTISPECIES: AAA family ATPase [unclassified Streptomyces]|uniref:AAA family ATPase n=1 Tax=unclassified Streptomyces TaxID=2593676 RepID=UPI0008815C40|nr:MULTISPECIES: SMC family ATPase [unclassified Streptomyces]PBC86682.1 exonuclease SbcC [Streptomyces sp. 2321.6]SDQ75916.1 exonuclease SbcC [Streptomyces sp. KS_16]SED51456.1 exonuclease SbcC [Streptomyces sp. 2112.3]SEE06142.1 exonuclease SbcC [Streptomyces sp. 2133.1]SNC73852.1 exonuclease SbcC [Streptomyces sp. 2114.4]
MRLHRLSLTAFGPFGGTQTIDFDRLSRDGLFLLHGPTGAGKTSVLDAVCFALYGSVPGARQSGQALRSDLADPLTLTEVVLELTVAQRRLEITRLPEQPRPKKRGSGTTKEKAQSRLREFVPAAGGGGAADGHGPADGPGGHWKALSRSHQEIGEEIGQLLGMSKEQFCQVVLLPQGDFARFLRADAEARSRLLGRLFDTRRFAALEEQLNVRRKAAADTVTAGDERLLALAHRMAQAAGESADLTDPSVPAPDRAGPAAPGAPARGRGRAAASTARATVPGQAGPVESGGRGGTGRAAAGEDRVAAGPGEPGFAEAVLVRAAVARVSARERLAVAQLAVHAAEAAEHRAAGEWEEARERDRLQQRYADARRRAARLDARAGERAHTRERLERARAAAEVAPALALRDAAWHELDAAQRAERQARSPLPAALADAESDHLAAKERQAREDLGSLGAARRAERRAAELGRERAALDREARADDQTLRDAAEWLAAWGDDRRAHQQRIDTAQEAATRADQLAARIAPAAERWEAARRRDRLSDDVRSAEGELLVAREQSAAAHEHWLDLKDRRLRGIAAELADGLRDGQACAVCGATEHPAPARPGAGHVDRTAEEAALAAHRRAEEARQQAEAHCQSAKEALAAAAATAGSTPTGELGAQVEELRAGFARAGALAADLPAALEALGDAEREYERRRDGQQQAERRVAARTSRREALDRERAALEEELARARGDSPSVAERAARLERQVALLAAAAEAARTAGACDRRLQDAEAGLSDAAHRAGFDTPQAAAEALLRDGEWRELQQRLDDWQAESAAVEAELADPGASAAAALPPADPVAAQTAHQAAAARLRSASATHAAARDRCTELDRLSARAEADARALAPLRAGYERIARLAALASGTSTENERRMRLESYVLAARLEQVAAAATARLQRMSGGRYTLVHSDERVGGARRSGLGLHVIDAWTGHERDTSSLSGGETFFASLALALGLADVVTDEAGGTRLDTLFIDEGFGSLDEQTLDEVLDVLDSLRERDRSVGIVSHVADLKARIPAQLEVVKDRSGSTVRHRVRG